MISIEVFPVTEAHLMASQAISSFQASFRSWLDDRFLQISRKNSYLIPSSRRGHTSYIYRRMKAVCEKQCLVYLRPFKKSVKGQRFAVIRTCKTSWKTGPFSNLPVKISIPFPQAGISVTMSMIIIYNSTGPHALYLQYY